MDQRLTESLGTWKTEFNGRVGVREIDPWPSTASNVLSATSIWNLRKWSIRRKLIWRMGHVVSNTGMNAHKLRNISRETKTLRFGKQPHWARSVSSNEESKPWSFSIVFELLNSDPLGELFSWWNASLDWAVYCCLNCTPRLPYCVQKMKVSCEVSSMSAWYVTVFWNKHTKDLSLLTEGFCLLSLSDAPVCGFVTARAVVQLRVLLTWHISFLLLL